MIQIQVPGTFTIFADEITVPDYLPWQILENSPNFFERKIREEGCKWTPKHNQL